MEKLEIFHKIEKVLYLTQPSPVILVSTSSHEKKENVAPFAMFMNCSSQNPPMIALAISPKTDTYENIQETKQFIVGIPKEDMLEKLCLAGEKVDKKVSEFELANLTPYASKTLQCKRIKECVVNIDCVFEQEIKTGNHQLIVGKVVDCDIDEDKYAEDKLTLRKNICNIYHITGNHFMVNGEGKSYGE